MAFDSLSEYGNSFQTKVITALMVDNNFLSENFDMLIPDYFESDANAFIISTIIEYYTQYRTSPSLQIFSIKVNEITSEILKATVIEKLREIHAHIGSTDLPYVKNEFHKFCENQAIKGAIIASVDLLKAGKFEEIKHAIDTAFRKSTSKSIGHDYIADVDQRLGENRRINLCPTEWSVLNDITDGGLGEGDMAVLVGGPGSGKSWGLVSIGLHAAKMGKNVVHFTLELNENYTAMRYDSRLCGITTENLKYHIEDVKEKIADSMKGKIVVKYFPSKSASVITLKSQLNKMMNMGFIPDLVIVDYADLLRSDSITATKAGSYQEVGSIYEDLRGMAGEFKVPLWTASQAQRAAADDDIITGERIAESYKKVMTADLVISVSRKTEDKLANVARWHVIKNRYGLDGLTFPSKMDTSIGKIEMFAPNTPSASDTRNEMRNSNEVMRRNLANRYEDMIQEKKAEGFE